MNIPSYSALLDKTKLIRTVQELCELVNNIPSDVIYALWIGAGQGYDDVLIDENKVPSTRLLKASKDVVCAEGDNIFIIVKAQYNQYYRKADINGFEIPTTSSQVTVSGEQYYVYESDNVYTAGTYTVNVNG